MNPKEKLQLALFMINKAARDYHIGRMVVASRFIEAHRRKFSPIEIAENDLLNVSDHKIRLQDFVSNEELLSLQKRLNPVHLSSETEDKLVFADFCSRYGLPTTTTVGNICLDNQAMAKDSDNVAFDLDRLLSVMAPGEYVLKPVDGCHGKGVIAFTYPVHSGSCETENLITSHCKVHSEFDRWLVEERLFNHAEVLELSPSRALQTVRVVTFVDTESHPTVMAAQWRLASVSSVVDNFCFGTNSGLLCNILPESGEIEIAYRGKRFPYEFALDSTDRHMETGRMLVGQRVPLWEDVVKLAKRAALAILPSRSIGWDIALTGAGPRLVEGNRYWDAHNEDGQMRKRLVWMQKQL